MSVDLAVRTSEGLSVASELLRPKRAISRFILQNESQRAASDLQMLTFRSKVFVQKGIHPDPTSFEPVRFLVVTWRAVEPGVTHEAAVLMVDDVLIHEWQKVIEQILTQLFSQLF